MYLLAVIIVCCTLFKRLSSRHQKLFCIRRIKPFVTKRYGDIVLVQGWYAQPNILLDGFLGEILASNVNLS